MKQKFIILLGLIAFFSAQNAYGDRVEAKGKWGSKDYRSITALPPTLSIEGNVLSVEFTDALDGLTIHITDEAGIVVYENVVSGDRGEILNIPLEGKGSGIYQVILNHRLGWLVGGFEIQ